MKEKILLSLVAFMMLPLTSIALPNPQMTCRVEFVYDDNVFEEGLGVYGDLDVDGDSQEIMIPAPYMPRGSAVQIGQMSYSVKDGDKIDVRSGRQDYTVDVAPKGSNFRLQFKYFRKSQRGIALVADGNGKFRQLAAFDCSSTATVLATEILNKNATELKGQRLESLEKKIKDRLDVVDFAFELGDGYYDLKESRYYEVRDPGLNVVGYIAWARLHYTEDNEEIAAQVKFDRNGLRLGEIERLGSCETPLKR